MTCRKVSGGLIYWQIRSQHVPVDCQGQITDVSNNLVPVAIPSFAKFFQFSSDRRFSFCLAKTSFSLLQQLPIVLEMRELQDDVKRPEAAGPLSDDVRV